MHLLVFLARLRRIVRIVEVRFRIDLPDPAVNVEYRLPWTNTRREFLGTIVRPTANAQAKFQDVTFDLVDPWINAPSRGFPFGSR